MYSDFTFKCSKCGNELFRSSHQVNTLNDINGAICSRCYNPVAAHDVTEQKIRRIQLIIQRKVFNDMSAS